MQITDIRNERRDINAHLRNIKRIIKEYPEHLHDHTFHNLDEMD